MIKFNAKEYYRKWNAENRERKRQWMWNKRHSIENPITKKPFIPRIIELPEHSTGNKRNCCWCKMEKELVFCSKKCKSEYEKFGMNNLETITPEFVDALMAT